ncbi:MAG: DUF899 domain-containing protein [Mesorhizobium sp.]|nr:MAG: DUF899 domain-containing protein [Mesorhizobium sp.]
MSVFALQDGAVYHTYSTYARGTEVFMGVYRFLDLAPWGRNENGLEFPQAWWRFPWVSSLGSDFKYDFGAAFTEEQQRGGASLADLFQGRSQLFVYHFMFGYGYRLTDERRGCTGCSLIADHFDCVIPHLNGRNITLVCESIAPLQELQDYKQQMGWRFPPRSPIDTPYRSEPTAAPVAVAPARRSAA